MARPRTKALDLIKAGDLVRAAERRVTSCERALEKARKARERAESDYMTLITESLAARQRQPAATGEEASAQSPA